MDTLSFGFFLVFSMMTTSMAHVLIQTRRINWLILGSVILSMIFFLGFSLIYDAICVACAPGESPYQITYFNCRQGRFWLTNLLVLFLALLPRFSIKAVLNTVHPSIQ